MEAIIMSLLRIILLCIFIIELILFILLTCRTYQGLKEDKKFNDDLNKINEEFLKQLKEQPAIKLNAEGDIKSEQKKLSETSNKK